MAEYALGVVDVAAVLCIFVRQRPESVELEQLVEEALACKSIVRWKGPS